VLQYLPLSIGVSTVLAAVISIVIGKPEVFLENLLVSVLIGTVAFILLLGAKQLFWDYPEWTWREWIPYGSLSLAVAPVAHFSGLYVGYLLLGLSPPSLTKYVANPPLSTMAFVLIGTGMMVFAVQNRERLQQARDQHAAERLRAEVIERQALQAQLRLMQAQIEPHMLFNTLANLQGLIAIDPERASAMLDQLIQYLRATLNASRLEKTTLEQEFASMHAYLGLMGVRMGERLAHRLDLPPELRSMRLPTMLLQPLVENAIVHGLEPKIDGGEIVIRAMTENGALVIEVADTGLGLGQMHGPRGTGVGVATTRERLAALYGAGAALTLTPAQPQGTLVRLTLPLETA